MGLTPVEAPAVFSLLAAIELDNISENPDAGRPDVGVFYPMGGFGQFPQLLADAATASGVDIRTSTASRRFSSTRAARRAYGPRAATSSKQTRRGQRGPGGRGAKALGDASRARTTRRAAIRRRRSRSCGRWTGASSSCSTTTSSCPRMKRMPTIHFSRLGTTSCRLERLRRSPRTGSISICVVIVGRTRPRRRPPATRSWSCVQRRP